MMNKKGDTMTAEQIIFLVLNIFFFLAMLAFVYRSSSGALVYEQVYSKQIAIIIDEAKPNTTVILDIYQGVEIANKNKKNIEKVFSIDNDRHEITVSLSNKGGYKYQFFRDLDVEYRIERSFLILTIK